MKKLLLLCLPLLFLACTKQKTVESLTNAYPTKFIYNDKYGLFNSKTKEVILYPRYTFIQPFSEGYGLGILGDEGNHCEVIDTSGNILYSYETAPLSHTYCFNGFFYYVKDSDDEYYHGLYDYKGKQVFKCNFIYSMNNECIITKEKSKYAFIFFDKNGIRHNKLLLSDSYSYEPFSNGYARFSTYNDNEKLFGIIKSDKTVLIPPTYKYLGKEFIKDFLIAENENSLYGLLNKEGYWVIQPKYEQLYNYSGKVLSAKFKNWQIMDLKENIIRTFPDNLTVLSDFFDDLAIFSLTTDNSTKYGLMDIQGEFVLNNICEKILPNPDNGYWIVLIDDEWMLFKRDEGLLNPKNYLDFYKVKN